MPPTVESPRAPRTPPPLPAAAVPARRPAALPDRGRRQTPAQATAADAEAAPLRDRGLSLFAIFTIAMLVMVGLAVLTAIVGDWWILIPVMIVDLAATAAVLAGIASLLGDGDSGAG